VPVGGYVEITLPEEVFIEYEPVVNIYKGSDESNN